MLVQENIGFENSMEHQIGLGLKDCGNASVMELKHKKFE